MYLLKSSIYGVVFILLRLFGSPHSAIHLLRCIISHFKREYVTLIKRFLQNRMLIKDKFRRDESSLPKILIVILIGGKKSIPSKETNQVHY